MYNRTDITEAAKMVKSFNKTCRIKELHKSQVYNLQNLIEEVRIKSNSQLLYYETFYSFQKYKKAVTIFYKETTKKDLDHKLNFCLITIFNELESLLEYC